MGMNNIHSIGRRLHLYLAPQCLSRSIGQRRFFVLLKSGFGIDLILFLATRGAVVRGAVGRGTAVSWLDMIEWSVSLLTKYTTFPKTNEFRRTV